MENPPESKKSSTPKKPLEELDKEELIAKCKGFFTLAQKAKLAKSELQNEVDTLQNQLKDLELESQAKGDKIHTLQELVDSLTEQKLTYITEIDSSQSKLKVLNVKCQSLEEEIHKLKDELSNKDNTYVQVTQKLSEFDNEIVSLKRQNTRLLDENEQLINQMTELEAKTEEFNKIGLQQQEQLKILEEKTRTDDNKEINEKIRQLEEIQEIHANCLNKDAKLDEITDLYKKEKQKNEKANNKLRVYKDKILKFANCINHLKDTRSILNTTLNEYSENIPRWQTEIMRASTLLDEQLMNLTTENSALKARLENYEKNATEPDVNQAAELERQLGDEITELRSENQMLNNQIKEILEGNKTLEEQVKEFKEQLYNESVVNKELRQSVDELNKQLTDLHSKEKNEEKLKYQIKSLESEKAILVKEKFVAKESIAELENTNKSLNEQITELKSHTEELKRKIEIVLQENENLKTKLEKDEACDKLKEECSSYKDMFENLKKEYDNLQDLNGLLKEEVQTLKLSLEQPKDEVDDLSDLNVSLQADIVKLETKLLAYKQENGLLLTEVKDCRAKIKELDKLVVENEEAKSKLINYKTENAELLNEMKEINQVLKERGEAISKLQKAVSEMERLIETLEKDRDSIKDERNELLKIVETLKSDLNNAEINKSENKNAYEQIVTEKENAIKILKDNESTIATLQEEIEKLKQQIPAGTELPNEDMSTSTISRAEEHARMKDLDETFEDKYSKLRLFALKLKKKLNETLSQLQAVEQENIKLKKQLDSAPTSSASLDVTDGFAVAKDEKANELTPKMKSLQENIETLEKSNTKLEEEVKKVNEQLSKEIDSHKSTKEQLEKALRDVKKKNVLSLEMEDYERSMKELTTKMEDNKKKIVQMESTIDTQEGTITAMKTQIKLLEEQIKSEEAQNRRTKEELHHAFEESKEKDNIINVKNDIITNLTQELEDEKRKKEETDLDMTAQLAEKEKVIITHAEEKIELNNKIKRLEFRCAELNDKLQVSNIELADLKTDYASYKVRAQAVLRQNQTVDHSYEEQLKEEAAALKTQVEALTQKLAAVQEQCSVASSEAESQRKRAGEAEAEASRAQARTARLHADLARLSQQIDADRNHHKLQVSTLTQCYKSQISELEVKLQKETESLKKQLALLQETAKAPKPEESTSEKYLLPVIPKEEGSDTELDINVSLIPREEGEGSESAPSPPLSKSFLSAGSRRSPIPLERLLEEGVSEDDGLDRSSLSLTAEQEIAELKRKVQGQQQKVKHVTVLLAESERECARMAQLAELLKSELRRVRGADLAPHNTEYMKNVTLKFLTLPPGDEKSRLIPVLQKILTLSNEETQKIQAVAKGQDPNSSKGWGSYLPWPGGK
ncbi:GRIP and coiled-coil domain-containing protein 2-like [Aricia agestis]|uniref:GRIP and coiled-coil domain-containing protein 2-like n=1 Tax=Aricia agestis TaxID=91739 RepID=UPI001C207E46|nr:GRIP and coiled-coil domain-containing protein 2-like [Aricia agestis]